MDWHSVTDTPLILGHRGASAEAPENTLPAFSLAQADGADGIEFDVQMSADGVPVIIHDRLVDRTTNGQGVVSDLTVAQLQAFDAGQGAAIPTLSQLFTTFGASFLYNLELKTFSPRDNGLAAAAAAMIVEFGLTRQVLVSSFDVLALRRARRLLPAETPTALLWVPGQSWWRYLYRDAADHPNYRAVTPRYMRWARRHNLLVNVWTVDDPAEARRLAALGVTAIISNRPRFIRAALSEAADEG